MTDSNESSSNAASSASSIIKGLIILSVWVLLVIFAVWTLAKSKKEMPYVGKRLKITGELLDCGNKSTNEENIICALEKRPNIWCKVTDRCNDLISIQCGNSELDEGETHIYVNVTTKKIASDLIVSFMGNGAGELPKEWNCGK